MSRVSPKEEVITFWESLWIQKISVIFRNGYWWRSALHKCLLFVGQLRFSFYRLHSIISRWSSTPVEERCALLNKLAEVLEKQSKELAETESRDQGKPVSLAAAVDIPRLVHNFRFFAGYLPHALEKFVF